MAETRAKCCINLGGEGEVPGAINANLPYLMSPGFVAARDGNTKLKGVKKSGPVVICNSDQLPFADSCADEVLASGVPVNQHSYLGAGYKTSDMKRIAKPTGKIVINGELV